jgi:hypothetical protein
VKWNKIVSKVFVRYLHKKVKPREGGAFSYFTSFISRCFPAFMQRVQIFMRPPKERGAHWRLGYFRTFPVGLNLVARTRLEYPPAIIDPLLHTGHVFAAIRFFDFVQIFTFGSPMLS